MKILFACLFTYCAALGQQAPLKLEFEEASIKPADPSAIGQIRVGMSADAGLLRYTNVSLRDCIRVAYRVKQFQVDGPDWLDSERFNIVAKLPAGSSQEQIPDMLEALLASRFKLTLHRTTKEHAIYALVAGKDGPKLKPAEVTAGHVGGAAEPGGNPGPGGPGRGGIMMMRTDGSGAHLKAPSVTLGGLAEMLSRFSERPVVDMTGIEGQYDFDLVFSPETMRNVPKHGGEPMPAPGGDGAAADPAASIYDSVQRYGLKLEPRKAAMEILTVDHIEKAPTEN
jgi:uncharacterized protein (TIGR03435 family)